MKSLNVLGRAISQRLAISLIFGSGFLFSANVTAHENELQLASNLPAVCQDSEIFRLRRPISSDGAATGVFSYGFRFKAPTREGAPVLVFLPGGPGGTSIDHPPAFVPSDWGYLLTDPRGVGCNSLAALPPPNVSSAFFRTQEIAADVIAAIRYRKLDNYILFGVSYGTLLATTVAHVLERDKMAPPPKAVVLEGVLGRIFGNGDRDFQGAQYIVQWDRIRKVLPKDVLTELDVNDAPFGIKAEGWARMLTALLPRGPADGAILIAALSVTQPEDVRQNALNQILGLSVAQPHTEPGAVELYRQVVCREISDTTPTSDLDVTFVRGRLVRNFAEEGSKCGGLKVTSPYDSAQLPYMAKTFYFIGDSDVATPAISQGAYHFEHHQGHAIRVITVDGGHNSLRFNQGACAPSVMEGIDAGVADLAKILKGCPNAVQVDEK
jgi:pimeloyl-ACP methyl ester carboxylesterase